MALTIIVTTRSTLTCRNKRDSLILPQIIPTASEKMESWESDRLRYHHVGRWWLSQAQKAENPKVSTFNPNFPIPCHFKAGTFWYYLKNKALNFRHCF